MKSRSKSFDLQDKIPEPEKSADSPKDCKFNLFKGLFLGLMSGVFYSLISVLVKDMKNLHPGQLSLYRFVALFACSLPQVIQSGENVFGPKHLRFLLLLRGLIGGAYIFFNFIAFRYLPLGEATVIVFSLPVFVTVAARVFLKEPCSTFQSVTVVLTVLGIVFTAKLPSRLMGNPVVYSKDSIYGLIGAIAALCLNTAHYIVIRKIKSVHHAVMMFNFALVAIVEIVIMTYAFGDFKWHYCGAQSWFIILIGFLSYVGQTMVVIALQIEFAGPVSTMKAASDIVLAFIWQTFLFHNAPDLFSIIGAFLVVFSVVFVGVSKWMLSLPKESPQRKN
ncbi:solute carrier family 35 member G1 [Nephila pilipes]|uniref:Solute carrier family 35 member G1 n=1 Tax=Nephila pilipes TaxID=299642 RepID=A0A8X6U0T5_NEPPI|nr:solute carrier family 35 member G1 [Nephila pilipes]